MKQTENRTFSGPEVGLGDIPFREFLDFWGRILENQPKAYGVRVIRFVGWVAEQGKFVSVAALREFLDCKTAEGSAASTVCGYFWACKAALLAWHERNSEELPAREAALQGWQLEHNLAFIKLPRPMKGKRAKMVAELLPDEVGRVIRAATPRIGAVIEFLARTGVRVEEMCDIRVKDVAPFNPQDAFVTIHGKGRKERAVWIPEPLLARIRRVFGGREFLFETRTGRPLDQDNVRKDVRRTFARVAGISLTPHSMRHYFATTMLGKGVSIGAVGEQLGHSDKATTANSYDVSRITKAQLDVNYQGGRGRKTKEGAKG